MTDTTDNAELRELIQRLDEERTDVMKRKASTEQGAAHRAGVACGMDYCIDELEALLEPDEAGELLAAAKNDDRSAEEVWESQQELNEE